MSIGALLIPSPKPSKDDMQVSSEVNLRGVSRQYYKPLEFLERICSEAKNGRNVLTELHKQVNEKPSSFDDFLEHPNLNRFPNVLCLDRSRVRVSKAYGTGDYCHASYVDSLEQKNGYILSQAPFSSETEELFWRMVLDAYPKIILVLGSLSAPSGPSMRCFWPRKNDKCCANGVRISLVSVGKEGEQEIFNLMLSMGKTELMRVPLVNYRAWHADLPVPDLGEFRQLVKTIESKLEKRTGPTVLVCPSGATRCGTYAAVDVILSRILKEKRVGVKDTIEIILSQRYGCFQLIEHYKTIHDIAQRYCILSGMPEIGRLFHHKSAKAVDRSETQSGVRP